MYIDGHGNDIANVNDMIDGNGNINMNGNGNVHINGNGNALGMG